MAPIDEKEPIAVGPLDPVEGTGDGTFTRSEISEKPAPPAVTVHSGKNDQVVDSISPAASNSDKLGRLDSDEHGSEHGSEEAIIVNGADAAAHLLPMRDDFDPSVTFRGIFLASVLAAFQACMFQIYNFKPTTANITGTFLVLIAYFLGKAWAAFLPRGDHLEARWRQKGGQGEPPLWIKVVSFFNYGEWGLKEHTVCSITASSASNASISSVVFAAQNLFYDLPLSAVTVILGTISIGLFGYGLAGLIRPIAVWHVESVYWSTLPTVKALQGLHWQHVKDSKPIRYFWYAFTSMFAYEWFPAYIWPWLNSVSIPCLASMNATGQTAATLTNIFGGSTSNEGLGLFSLTFDWQYITSFSAVLPLKFQLHAALGFFTCFIVMAGIYWGNAFDSKSLPFMATTLRMADGSKYPVSDVFPSGVLNETALLENGIPRLTGTFVWAVFMANAAIGALIIHCILFWGGDVIETIRSAKKGKHNDPHHEHMAKHYKETPWTWYIGLLVISFVLGLAVVLKENITLPAWGYVVALIVGTIVAPFSTLLYARYGNGIATNNLSKLVAGLILPGLPIGNMYFSAWSHNVISSTVNLCNDLKMGEYLKIPPRTMFLTQIWGSILGGFINYAVMVSIVTNNREILVEGNGDSTWSGAYMQSYNTSAASWALAKYLYLAGRPYEIVPIGVAVGAGVVVLHRIFTYFVPKIRNFSTNEINMPQFLQYAGFIPYNQSQTCVIFSQLIAGFYCQYYLRNYKPRIFKEYMYLITAAWDGAALCVLFILSFAFFGAGGRIVPFPTWWGNNVDGNYDLCPVAE